MRLRKTQLEAINFNDVEATSEPDYPSVELDVGPISIAKTESPPSRIGGVESSQSFAGTTIRSTNCRARLRLLTRNPNVAAFRYEGGFDRGGGHFGNDGAIAARCKTLDQDKVTPFSDTCCLFKRRRESTCLLPSRCAQCGKGVD